MMRNTAWTPWVGMLIGLVAIALPALRSVVGMALDRSSLRHDPTYARLIPPVMWGSLLLAAVVPAVLVMRSAMSLPKRIALTVAIWCLLALECLLALYIATSGVH